jgi:Kef-type K+ transport system membrane component KefB
LTALTTLGVIGIAYIIARSFGLIAGGGFAARLVGAPPVVTSHIGWCLLPQAGVALGLALLVSERLPEIGNTIMPLIVATTVIFELVAPPITRWHLRKAGELNTQSQI